MRRTSLIVTLVSLSFLAIACSDSGSGDNQNDQNRNLAGNANEDGDDATGGTSSGGDTATGGSDPSGAGMGGLGGNENADSDEECSDACAAQYTTCQLTCDGKSCAYCELALSACSAACDGGIIVDPGGPKK
jgi:hypothetical protein